MSRRPPPLPSRPGEGEKAKPISARPPPLPPRPDESQVAWSNVPQSQPPRSPAPTRHAALGSQPPPPNPRPARLSNPGVPPSASELAQPANVTNIANRFEANKTAPIKPASAAKPPMAPKPVISAKPASAAPVRAASPAPSSPPGSPRSPRSGPTGSNSKPEAKTGAVAARAAMFQQAAEAQKPAPAPKPTWKKPKPAEAKPPTPEPEPEVKPTPGKVTKFASMFEQQAQAAAVPAPIPKPKPVASARPPAAARRTPSPQPEPEAEPEPVRAAPEPEPIPKPSVGGVRAAASMFEKAAAPPKVTAARSATTPIHTVGSLAQKKQLIESALAHGGAPPPGGVEAIPTSEAALERRRSSGSLGLRPGGPPLPARNAQRRGGPRAKALYDFDGDTREGELPMFTGDIVYLNRKINEEWYAGELESGEQGIFPANFVDVLEPLPEPGRPPAPAPTPTSAPAPAPSFTRAPSSTAAAPPARAPAAAARAPTPKKEEPHAIAMFDFEGQESDELSFFKDEKIILLEKIDADWYKGRAPDGSEGIFPKDFVQVVVEVEAAGAKESKPAGTKLERKATGTRPSSRPASMVFDEAPALPTRQVRALYDYEGEVDGELSFQEGDVITVTGEINADWLEGKIRGMTGMFPSVFVEDIDSAPTPLSRTPTAGSGGAPISREPSRSKKAAPPEPHGIALYDMDAGDDDELAFSEGDKIKFISRINDEWYEGENDLTGQTGMFPLNFVDIVVDLP